jgi:hypothetical protein
VGCNTAGFKAPVPPDPTKRILGKDLSSVKIYIFRDNCFCLLFLSSSTIPAEGLWRSGKSRPAISSPGIFINKVGVLKNPQRKIIRSVAPTVQWRLKYLSNVQINTNTLNLKV